jgi:V/A-type H+/Na+-transporting ATPase subunit K
MNSQQKVFKHRISLSLMIIALLMTVFSLVATAPIYAEEVNSDSAELSSANSNVSSPDAERQKWGMMAAALAFGFGAIGAGMAIAKVGSAAMGAMSERPEIGSQALIFVAMAEGIVIFGFISALMILGKF